MTRSSTYAQKGRLDGAAIIFDLDGTLIDTAADLLMSVNHALGQAGVAAAPLDQVRHLVGGGARRMLRRGFEIATGREASAQEVEEAFGAFRQHYANNIAIHSRPFEFAIEMIEEKRMRGASISICTNKTEALAKQLIEALGLTSLFEIIVGADTATAAKPDPSPVLLCLKKMKATRAVFIGDSDTDIRAAKTAGLPSLIAEFGYGPTTLKNEAQAMFADYRAASDLIDATLGDVVSRLSSTVAGRF